MIKFSFSMGIILIEGYILSVLLIVSVFEHLRDPIIPILFIIATTIAFFLILMPLYLYYEKVGDRCRNRRDEMVLAAMKKRLAEKEFLLQISIKDEDMVKNAQIGICLIEYNILAEHYPLPDPMKYIIQAIVKS